MNKKNKQKTRINQKGNFANINHQLKEIRDESFKQGVWKGKEDVYKHLIKLIDYMIDFETAINKLRNELEKVRKEEI